VIKHLLIPFRYHQPCFNMRDPARNQKIWFYTNVCCLDALSREILLGPRILDLTFVGTSRYHSCLLFISRKTRSAIQKEKLKMAKFVCTTADCWTSRRRSFIVVTVHWLTEDLLRKSGCLAVRRIKGVHNYSTIAKSLEEIHEEFKILNKTTACVTDSGWNFVKCFRLFGAKLMNVWMTESAYQKEPRNMFFTAFHLLIETSLLI